MSTQPELKLKLKLMLGRVARVRGGEWLVGPKASRVAPRLLAIGLIAFAIGLAGAFVSRSPLPPVQAESSHYPLFVAVSPAWLESAALGALLTVASLIGMIVRLARPRCEISRLTTGLPVGVALLTALWVAVGLVGNIIWLQWFPQSFASAVAVSNARTSNARAVVDGRPADVQSAQALMDRMDPDAR